MKIPLRQFEQYIDETILQRGLSYFKKGYVNTPEEITSGKFEAIVQGTEDYTVEVQIKNETITDYSCTCPYDLGPVCKHVVAVIFYLQKEELDIRAGSDHKRNGTEKIKKGTGKKRQTVAQQVTELLDNISHEELREFIHEKAESNASFRNLFISSFAHRNKNETQETYNKQIRSILRQAAGRDGFIDWSGTRHVGNMVHGLVTTARNQFQLKNPKSAVLLCCAVMEEMTEALQFADDSNGDIGGPIEEAAELLHEIASSKELPEELRKHLFSYCLNTFNKNIFSGWDWHIDMLDLASCLIKSNEDGERVIAILDKVKNSEYEAEKAQSIKLNILKKLKGEKEADRFMEQNLSNPSLRETALEKAFSKKDYIKVIQIAKEGILHDKKDKPGLVYDWYDWLLKVAKTQHDKEKIIEYARLMFIESHRHDHREHYKLMKTHVEKGKWEDFVHELVKEIIKNSRFGDFHLVAEIYINEQWWDKLLAWIKQNSLNMEGISEYEKYLSKDYAPELADIYEKKIVEYLKRSTGRGNYKTACRFMRRMLKLGAKEKVNRMIEIFRKEYIQRRALMEELDRI
ncbi:MAG: SWIM zinc finger family protein [Bacteroidetes bacterium]|nr:SWIM zinc finger family protein [Bacteroidota bacterium]